MTNADRIREMSDEEPATQKVVSFIEDQPPKKKKRTIKDRLLSKRLQKYLSAALPSSP